MAAAVGGKGKDRVRDVLFAVGVHDHVFGQTFVDFNYPPGNLLAVDSRPVVSLSLVSESVEGLSADVFFSHEFRVPDPVSSEDVAAVGSVAAEAALSDEREYHVPLGLPDELDAGSGLVGDGSAKSVVPAIRTVHPRHIPLGIVPHLSHHVEFGRSVTLNEVLLKSDRPDRRSLTPDRHQQHE